MHQDSPCIHPRGTNPLRSGRKVAAGTTTAGPAGLVLSVGGVEALGGAGQVRDGPDELGWWSAIGSGAASQVRAAACGERGREGSAAWSRSLSRDGPAPRGPAARTGWVSRDRRHRSSPPLSRGTIEPAARPPGATPYGLQYETAPARCQCFCSIKVIWAASRARAVFGRGRLALRCSRVRLLRAIRRNTAHQVWACSERSQWSPEPPSRRPISVASIRGKAFGSRGRRSRPVGSRTAASLTMPTPKPPWTEARIVAPPPTSSAT